LTTGWFIDHFVGGAHFAAHHFATLPHTMIVTRVAANAAVQVARVHINRYES
jgi:hypothetical protein